MAELRAPEQNRLLGQLARMLRTTEGDIAAPEFLPRGLDVMGLVRQLMLPSAETVEKLSYGDPLFRMPTQSNIPITADREYLADIAGMIPFGAPAARPSARAMQDLVRQIQTEPPTGAISPEIAARFLPETKVVDEAGNPKLLYHGTNKEFEQFDESMLGTKTGNPTSKMGYFFSDSPSEASRYAADWGKEGGNVRPVYLDIKNPKRLTYKQMNDISMALFDESSSLPVNAWKTKEGQAAIESSAIAGQKRANKMAMDLRQQLIDEGYDGAVVKIGGKDEYIAFNPNQIRSATSDPQMAGLLDQPAQSVEKVYHGTSPKAAQQIEQSGFDITKSADGSVWFTSNPEIGEVAATSKGAVVERLVDLNDLKLGGWSETDKFSTDELIQQGYDGLRLVDNGQVTYQIFNPEKLKKPIK